MAVGLKLKRCLFLILAVSLMAVQILVQPGVAHALTDEQKQLFAEGIYYFDAASSTNCSLTSSIDSTGQKIDLAAISKNYGIKWAEVKQLGGSVVDSVNPNESPPTVASILKIIIADAFIQTNPDLGQKVKVTAGENYFKDGSENGSLAAPKPGQLISLGDALEQTLTYSSDTDANVLIDAAGGLGKVNSMMNSLGYNNTQILSYYNSNGAGRPNQTSAADITSAMDKIFSSSGNNYALAQKYLQAEKVNYGISSDANKWGGTSKVSDNTALFNNISGSKYIITLFIDKDYAGDTNGANKDSGPYQIRNATAAIINALSNGAGSPVTLSPGAADTLPADVAQNIKKNQAAYQQASDATGVPWQLLAAIHYREGSNNPNSDMQAGNPFGGPYGQSSTDYSTYGYPTNLEQSAEIAAKHLIASSQGGIVNKPINVPSPDPDAVKDTLFSYNGRADVYAQQAASLGFSPMTQPYEGSPYVMNNYDAKHKNMQIITHDNGGLDGIDTRLGAFTIYSALLGYSPISTGGCSGNSASSAGGLASGTTQELAQQILNNSKITYDYGPNGEVVQPFKDLAAGNLASNNSGCPATQVSTHILQEILLLAQNHTVNVSALTTDHPCNNGHTLGRALDINILDGKHLGAGNGPSQPSLYDTPLSNTLMTDALPALVNGSGFGDCDGHRLSSTGVLTGVQFFVDNCNHVHTQVPPGN